MTLAEILKAKEKKEIIKEEVKEIIYNTDITIIYPGGEKETYTYDQFRANLDNGNLLNRAVAAIHRHQLATQK